MVETSAQQTEGFESTLAGPLADKSHQIPTSKHNEVFPESPAAQPTPIPVEEPIAPLSATSTHRISSDDPYALRGYKRDDASNESTQQNPSNRTRRRGKKVKKYYNRQNALIDAYLGSHEEEQLEIEDTLKNGGKVKFAVNASFAVNFFLFVIQLYAAISTGSLSLFATAADAFVNISIRERSSTNNSCRWIL
jgi:hypothetical protein